MIVIDNEELEKPTYQEMKDYVASLHRQIEGHQAYENELFLRVRCLENQLKFYGDYRNSDNVVEYVQDQRVKEDYAHAISIIDGQY